MITKENTQRIAEKLFQILGAAGSIKIPDNALLSNTSLNFFNKQLKKDSADPEKLLTKQSMKELLEELKMKGKVFSENGYITIAKDNATFLSGEYLSVLYNWIQEVIPGKSCQPQNWKIYSDLRELSFSFLFQNTDFIYSTNKLPDFFFNYLEYIIIIADYEKVEQLLQFADKFNQENKLSYKQTLQLNLLRAEYFRRFGESKKAEKLLLFILEELDLSGTENKVLYARAISELGQLFLFDDRLRFDEANDYLMEANEIFTNILGDDHEFTALSKLYLAEYQTRFGSESNARQELIFLLGHPSIKNNSYYKSLVFNALGIIEYKLKNDFSSILYLEKELALKEEILPPGHPLLLEAIHNKGMAYMDEEDYKKAMQYFEKTFKYVDRIFSPGHQNFLCITGAYAWCNIMIGKTGKAHKVLLDTMKKLEQYPRKSYGLVTLAMDYMVKHHHKEGNVKNEEVMIANFIPLLRKSGNEDSLFEMLLNRHFHLAKLNRKLDDLQNVKDELSSILYRKYRGQISKDPKNAYWYNHYGMLFKNALNDYKKAEECYREAIDLNVADSSTYNNLALLLTCVYHKDIEAEELYLRSFALSTNCPITLGNYGFFLQNAKKDYQEAENCYQKASKLAIYDSAIHNHYASLKMILGDMDEARSLITNSLKYNIGKPNRHQTVSFLLLLILNMFDCKDYSDQLSNIKYAINQGIDHVPWDNRTILDFTSSLLQPDEALLIERLFKTINDFKEIEKLDLVPGWKNCEALPFLK